MNPMLKWLKKIEGLAGKTYQKASHFFKEDAEFSSFLKKLADDESEHLNLLETFGNVFEENLQKISITMDTEIVHKIEHSFAEINSMIVEKKISKECMLEKLIDLEFSEWNDYFVYVFSLLNDKDQKLRFEIQKFQKHRKMIEEFCGIKTALTEKITQLRKRPPIWTENILIVEDEEIISDLLQKVLNAQGEIDVAMNGEEGIRKVKNKYYKLIISDIDMPVMDGMTFFRTARRMFPNINERFLFFTGNLTDDKMIFLNNNKLHYMLKPASLNEIKKNAEEILIKH